MCDYVICDVFFFFQAEDGIRDIGVTGVQTCALPISSSGRDRKFPSPLYGNVRIARLGSLLRASHASRSVAYSGERSSSTSVVEERKPSGAYVMYSATFAPGAAAPIGGPFEVTYSSASYSGNSTPPASIPSEPVIADARTSFSSTVASKSPMDAAGPDWTKPS